MNRALLQSSLRRLGRQLFQADLRLLALAVIIAVTAVVAVAAFSERVQRAIGASGAELLAADLVISSELDLDPRFAEEALARELETATSVVLRSVVFKDDLSSTAEVKAVSPAYPLRGTLATLDPISGEPQTKPRGPSTGHVWIDRELAASLKLAPSDRLAVGALELNVEAIIAREPDRANIGFAIAPRVLISLADLGTTGLIGPGALMDNNLLVAGPAGIIADYRRWLDEKAGAGIEVRDPATGSPRLAAAVARSERFLSLAALVCVLLAGAAMARLAIIYIEREADAIAVLRSLGARANAVTTIYLIQIVLIGLLGSAVGVALGYAAQNVIAAVLAPLFSDALPTPGWRPAAIGFALGLVSLLGFSAPALARLRKVSPLRLMTRRPGFARAHPAIDYGVTSLLVVIFVLAIARDWVLAGWLLLGIGAAIVCFGLITLAVIWILGYLRTRIPNAALRHGIANIVRRPRDAVTQATALGIGVMVLLLLTLVKDDLFESWEGRLPPDTPNFFFVNVLPDQRDDVAGLFADLGLATANYAPMVKARIDKINGADIKPADYEEGFARRMVARAANLSFTDELSDDNRIVAGSFGSDDGDVPLSVEIDYAEALGLSLGDEVEWLIEGSTVSTVVKSLREIDWDSFRPNFFLVVPTGVLDTYAKSYIGSVYVPSSVGDFRQRVVAAFPNITVIDVSLILSQIRTLLDRLNRAMGFIFLFTLAAGILVLLACVLTVERLRRRDIAIVKTVGGTNAFVLRALLFEFATLGIVAGVAGALTATVAGAVLASRVLGLDYGLDPSVFLLGTLGAAAIVTGAGLLATRSALNTAPWTVLR